MNFFLELAKKGNHDLFWLGAWPENHRAVAFYKKIGFQVIGEHAFPVGDRVDIDHIMAIHL